MLDLSEGNFIVGFLGKVTIKVTSTAKTTQTTMTDSTTYSSSTEPVGSSTVILNDDETSTEFTTFPTTLSTDYSEETTTMVC